MINKKNNKYLREAFSKEPFCEGFCKEIFFGIIIVSLFSNLSV